MPLVRELQANGVTTHREMARELERRGIKTPRGGNWWGAGAQHPQAVGPEKFSMSQSRRLDTERELTREPVTYPLPLTGAQIKMLDVMDRRRRRALRRLVLLA